MQRPTYVMNAIGFKKSGLFLIVTMAYFYGISGAAWGQSDSTILARVGEKEISVREFRQRTELTIRPDNFKDKNTALDNLISEKILALEALRTSTLPGNPVFQATLKGIKEQLMRDRLREEEGEKKVSLDTSEIKAAYIVSKREYEVEFYTLTNDDITGRVQAALRDTPELSDEVFNELQAMAGKKPVRKVAFKDVDDDAIHEALFSSPLEVGAIVGPVKLGSGGYIVMRVLNWVDYPLVSGEDQMIRWAEVKNLLRQAKGREIWNSYQAGVMKGKKVEFDREAFAVLSGVGYQYYLRNKQTDSLHRELKELPIVPNTLDLGAKFFTIDGKVWSVGDFQKELLSHPLVFRTTNLDSANFRKEFKLAIVDMIRDHYLTRESYALSLNASEEIHKSVEMWKDAFLAQDEEKNVIESALKEEKIRADDREGIRKYWLSYLQDVQQKYSDRVRIDRDALAKIVLTNVDFFAFRWGVPYPIAVPEFPLFISTQKLDSLLRKLQTL